MPVSDAVDWLRAELADDWATFRDDPTWYATARAMAEGWFGLALLIRQTVHNLVYGAVVEGATAHRETTLRYTECHVVGADEAVAHRCRFWTAMTAVGVAAAISPMLSLERAPVVSVLLVSNWALLVFDPLAPLFTALIETINP